jgi:phage terminase small subunit
MRSAEASAAKLFSEFGLTPSARRRLFSAAVHPVPTMHQTPDIADDYFEDEQQDSVQ